MRCARGVHTSQSDRHLSGVDAPSSRPAPSSRSTPFDLIKRRHAQALGARDLLLSSQHEHTERVVRPPRFTQVHEVSRVRSPGCLAEGSAPGKFPGVLTMSAAIVTSWVGGSTPTAPLPSEKPVLVRLGSALELSRIVRSERSHVNQSLAVADESREMLRTTRWHIHCKWVKKTRCWDHTKKTRTERERTQ